MMKVLEKFSPRTTAVAAAAVLIGAGVFAAGLGVGTLREHQEQGEYAVEYIPAAEQWQPAQAWLFEHASESCVP